MNNILGALFKTDAIKICDPDKPFWYTSGTIGPYYINTHFLWGSSEKASKLLDLIDEKKEDVLNFSNMLFELAYENYINDPVYKEVSDELVKFITTNVQVSEFDYISGGERRDWFFSFIAAKLLNKPHLTLYKDMRAFLVFQDGSVKEVKDIREKRVLHIADLITEASSYERAWLPAINKLNARMTHSFVIVDRNQGGSNFFCANDISYHSMVKIDKDTFNRALEMGLINGTMHKMITAFISDPKGSMRDFLIKNPSFIEKTIKEGGSNAKRAVLLRENNIYNL